MSWLSNLWDSIFGSEPEAQVPTGKWQQDWSNVILANLTVPMLSYRNEYFLTRTFTGPSWWLRFLQAVATTESSLDPNCVYVEDFIDAATNESCKSVGLFQLSLGDRINYPDCPTIQTLTADNLTDPVTNIKAAMEIINALITDGRDPSAYWSSMKPNTESGEQTLANLKELLK